jgi:hypothetical protein
MGDSFSFTPEFRSTDGAKLSKIVTARADFEIVGNLKAEELV